VLNKIKQTLKFAIGCLVFYGGFFHAIRLWNNLTGNRLTIVTYHRVTGQSIDSISQSLPFLFVSLSHFEQQLKFFKKYYKIINFEQLSDYVKKGFLPWNCLIVTFDDGYEDNYKYAYPLLSRLNVPSTLFITTNRVGNSNFKPFWWDRAFYVFNELSKIPKKILNTKLDRLALELMEEFKHDTSYFFFKLNKMVTEDIEELLNDIDGKFRLESKLFKEKNRMLNWQQITEMINMEIGSHSCNHYNLLELERTQQVYEVEESKKVIEYKIQKKVRAFCSPHGNMNDDLKELIKKAGYEYAVTCNSGINKLNDYYALKRINIWEGTSQALNGKFAKGNFVLNIIKI